jgi:hypothetical protein
MKTRPKKTAPAKAAPKKPKRTSKKNPKKTPVATPEKNYSKIEEIWADAPHDETRDYWIYDKLGIPLADRKGRENSLNEISSSLGHFFEGLYHLFVLGYFSDVAIISEATPKLLIALLDGKERNIPDFGRKKVVERIFKYFAKEYRKRQAVPDRKSAAQKKFYSRSCENALIKVLILHRAGWRRHWNSPRDLPKHPFGSLEGANDWLRWSMNFLAAIHKAGLIKANPNTKAAKGQDARGRVHVHKDVFTKLYSLSQAHLESKLDFHLARLNAEVERDYKGEFKTYTHKSALIHSDCAPATTLEEVYKIILTLQKNKSEAPSTA